MGKMISIVSFVRNVLQCSSALVLCLVIFFDASVFAKSGFRLGALVGAAADTPQADVLGFDYGDLFFTGMQPAVATGHVGGVMLALGPPQGWNLELNVLYAKRGGKHEGRVLVDDLALNLAITIGYRQIELPLLLSYPIFDIGKLSAVRVGFGVGSSMAIGKAKLDIFLQDAFSTSEEYSYKELELRRFMNSVIFLLRFDFYPVLFEMRIHGEVGRRCFAEGCGRSENLTGADAIAGIAF